MNNLKERAIRGGIARMAAQFVNTALRVGSVMSLARLLTPSDFGLVAMVAAVIGALNLFRDFGLSTATIQRTDVTDEQLSVLFWLNVVIGVVLAAIALAAASAIAAFFREPRLLWLTFALSLNFVINGLGIQHSALLQRQMRFSILAVIETLSLISSIAVGVLLATLGAGYWSLVGMALTATASFSGAVWIVSGWTPGWPRWDAGVGSMIRTGCIVTANGLVVYAAYNLEKVLLGRFWGADALGLYGRAYQLVNIPTENANSAVGAVVMSALSRVKDDPVRLRAYFLKGYSLLLAFTVPTAAACALFAEDVISVMLGPQWLEAATIFRLLSPTILIFGMINPLWPLMVATNLLVRSFKLGLVIAPVAIAGYVIGLPWGPKGVAIGFSSAMALWVLPHILWSIHGTGVTLRDVGLAVGRPLASALAATLVAGIVAFGLLPSVSPLLRLTVGVGVLTAVYLVVLLFAMGQRALYVEVLRGIRAPRST